MVYDILIIGGGAAGIMAALSARKVNPNLKIVICERNFSLGRKILVSGAGRCNLTNVNLGADNWRHRFVSDKPLVLDSVFKQYGFKDIMHFFDELGIETYEERKNNTGKIFPISDSAKNILQILNDELARSKIDIILNTKVNSVRREGAEFIIETISSDSKKTLLFAKRVVLAAGGKSYPVLGTDGSGFDFAMKLGHSMLFPVPAAGPVTSKDPVCKMLQGNRAFVSLQLYIDEKLVKTVNEELLFAAYGLSGSAIFYISRAVSVNFNRDKFSKKCFVNVNFVPAMDDKQLKTYLNKQWEKRPGQTLENSLLGLLNQKIINGLLQIAKLNPNKQVKDLSSKEIADLENSLTNFRIYLDGTRGWEDAEFTSGGILLAEVDETSLASKKCPELFLCGEVLNVDGDVGGFNLSWAWSSGWLAGKSAASF